MPYNFFQFLIIYFLLISSRVLTLISKLIGRSGTALPGILIEKYFSRYLDLFTKNVDQIIVITGTNGKTTSRSIINTLLESAQITAASNFGGANIMRGLAVTIISNLNWNLSPKAKYLVLEVEEATLPKLSSIIKIDRLLITNLFRDQLDAYGSIDQTGIFFTDSIDNIYKKNPEARLILNADDQKLLDFIPQQILHNSNLVSGFSINNHTQKYESTSFNHTIEPKLIVKSIEYKNGNMHLDLSPTNWISKTIISSLEGEYNAYNLIGAILTIDDLITQADLQILSQQKAVFGRGEIIKLGNCNIHLYLVKNPAGFEQVLETTMLKMLSLKNCALVFAINDNIADGRDVSWLWDVNLNPFVNQITSQNIQLLTSGSRGLDMLLRLQLNNLSVKESNYLPQFSQLLESINNHSDVFILATYTALNQIRVEIGKLTQIDDITNRQN
jgi:lipid II isoglutaminyl synthase (glutamine-hydrolysing)